VFAAYGLFLSLIGVPFGILLAAIAFLLEFIPLLGPLVAALAILIVAALSGFHHLLWILVFLIVFRVFQDYALSPHLLSKGAKLRPVVVIFGILAGGQIAGIPGCFLAIPILAILRIVYRQLKKKLLDSTPDRSVTKAARTQ
jgi:predicted PurR-regulated permease PerM